MLEFKPEVTNYNDLIHSLDIYDYEITHEEGKVIFKTHGTKFLELYKSGYYFFGDMSGLNNLDVYKVVSYVRNQPSEKWFEGTQEEERQKEELFNIVIGRDVNERGYNGCYTAYKKTESGDGYLTYDTVSPETLKEEKVFKFTKAEIEELKNLTSHFEFRNIIDHGTFKVGELE